MIGKQRMEVLHWISPIPYLQHHELVNQKLLPDSGHWLLTHQDFENWKRSSSSAALWLHGISGSGKSTLSSVPLGSFRDCSSAKQIIQVHRCRRCPQGLSNRSKCITSILLLLPKCLGAKAIRSSSNTCNYSEATLLYQAWNANPPASARNI